MGIKIAGTGMYVPEKILTNADLEKIVDTSDEWIQTRTGIKERHIADDNIPTSELAYHAALKALEDADVSADEIDLIIVASITTDKAFPSTSCILQSKLGASNAACFDLQAACSGLIYSLETAMYYIRGSKRYNKVLVLGAEKLSSITDWEDRSTCVLFGDGAAALVLERTDGDEECAIIASDLGADGNYGDILHLPAGGSAMPLTAENIGDRMQYLKMGGQEVFKLAVGAMVSSSNKVLEEAGVSRDEVKWLVPHQANYRILKAVASRLKIAEEKVYMNVDRYGNTSAASIGLCLDEMNRGNLVKSGDYVLLTAFGGGLTWGSMLLKWN
ncbi:beta-ketoacyl-ACP synthase III [Lentisphaerota bacterium WC36G]|nr:ketoacyl-ACP synthase III [Lentisphaerae bacterium WC36]